MASTLEALIRHVCYSEWEISLEKIHEWLHFAFATTKEAQCQLDFLGSGGTRSMSRDTAPVHIHGDRKGSQV